MEPKRHGGVAAEMPCELDNAPVQPSPPVWGPTLRFLVVPATLRSLSWALLAARS